MSQVVASTSSGTKKRKHGAAEGARHGENGVASSSRDAEEPSAKRSKKDKKAVHGEIVRTAAAAAGPPAVVSTTANPTEKKKDKKKKHKSLAGGHSATEGESEFHVVSASVQLSIPPVFALDLPAGARELLDSMLMRYILSLPAMFRSALQYTDRIIR